MDSYRGQGDIGDNDSVHGTGSSAEGLALVAVRVVLVFVDLAILRCGVPGHGALADANVALGGHGGGLAAEVPITMRTPAELAIMPFYECFEIMRHEEWDPIERSHGERRARHNGKWGEMIVRGVLGYFREGCSPSGNH